MATSEGDKISVRVNKSKPPEPDSAPKSKNEDKDQELKHSYIQPGGSVADQKNDNGDDSVMPSRHSKTIQPMNESASATQKEESPATNEQATTEPSSSDTSEVIDPKAPDDYGQKPLTIADYAEHQPPSGYGDEDTRDYKLSVKKLKKPPKRQKKLPVAIKYILILVVFAAIVAGGFFYVNSSSF